MSYAIRIGQTAKAETRQIYEYLSAYDLSGADKHLVRLTKSISLIGRDPFLCACFFITGAPYRAKLFPVGRTSFWIVYEVEEVARFVNILKVWNSKQDPDDFEF